MFAEKVINYTHSFEPDWQLPSGIDLIFPYHQQETMEVLASFYRKYFSDQHPRTFLFGINPGRFGAGVTGIPFTDPVHLADNCGIPNSFQKRKELSSIFIYEMIDELGGPADFYARCYITSVSHLGFIKDGKNINYYDDKDLQQSVEANIVSNIQKQLEFGCRQEEAFSIGQGKNFHYLRKLNDKHHFFAKVTPLPHPRWVMQYRRKRKDEFIEQYRLALIE